MDHTLLLSVGYEPLKVISWKKAVTLVFLEKVEVVEEYQREVHSPSVTFRLPAVVKLNRFLRPIPRRVKFSRQNIFFRDNYTCQYCHRPHPAHQLTYDHIVPRSKGGKTSWTNVVTSCIRCNLRKGSKPLHATNFNLLKKPEEPKWLPQFSHAFPLETAPLAWRDYLAFAEG
ncbi:MAG: HNH endonuclease [SAR324 cluster bacterium]|nr:HNH endonuclease [SAR324 cluster bacterium]